MITAKNEIHILDVKTSSLLNLCLYNNHYFLNYMQEQIFILHLVILLISLRTNSVDLVQVFSFDALCHVAWTFETYVLKKRDTCPSSNFYSTYNKKYILRDFKYPNTHMHEMFACMHLYI